MRVWLRKGLLPILLVGIAILTQSFGSALVASLVIIGALSAIVAVSLTVLTGWAGQPSLAPAGMMLAGGYCAVIIPSDIYSSLLVAAITAVVVGAIIGAATALPSLRLAGTYVLLGSLAVQQVLTDGGNRIEEATGASSGYSLGIPNIFGYSISSGNQWMWLSVIVLGLVCVYFAYLGAGRVGRSVRVIKTGKNVADVAGISSTRHLVSLFAATGAIMAVAGMLISYYNANVSYDAYTLTASLQFFVMAVIGGLGWIPGAIIGAVAVTSIPTVISQLLPYEVSGGAGSLTPYIQGMSFAVLGFIGVYLTAKRELAQLPPIVRKGREALGGFWVLASARVTGARPSSQTPAGRSPQSARPAATANFSGRVGGDRTTAGPGGTPVVAVSPLTVLPGPARLGIGTASIGSNPELVLELRGVGASYGPVEVLAGIDLSVRPRQIVTVLGRNGAGKSTLLRCVGGFPNGSSGRITSGRVRFGGHALSPAPHTARAAGIWLMPGDRKVFETLTVEEHIRLTHRLDSFDEAMQETRETFPPLARLVKAPAGNLSGGERQMLALACAFAARPSLVLIDELSQGLSPAAANRAMAAAMELRDRLGVAVLLVEQMVGLGFAVADEVIVMDGGEFVRQGEADESFKDWTEAYLLGGVVK